MLDEFTGFTQTNKILLVGMNEWIAGEDDGDEEDDEDEDDGDDDDDDEDEDDVG